jgi:hypothetical protein
MLLVAATLERGLTVQNSAAAPQVTRAGAQMPASR